MLHPQHMNKDKYAESLVSLQYESSDKHLTRFSKFKTRTSLDLWIGVRINLIVSHDFLPIKDDFLPLLDPCMIGRYFKP